MTLSQDAKIIKIHADPTAIADSATALAVSFACLTESLLSSEISSTTLSIAVFMHSIARMKIPPIINKDLSDTDIGNAMAAITEIAFAKPTDKYFAQWSKREKNHSRTSALCLT